MSLINEALKKAQRESQGSDAPAVRDVHIDSRPAGGGLNPGWILAPVLIAAVASGWYFLRDEPPAAPAEPAARASATPPVANPDVPVAPVAPVAPVVAPALVTPPPPVVSPAAPAVNPVPPAVEPAVVAPVAPVGPVANDAITELVAALKVSLVRKASSRVVIAGAVVKVGSRVSEEPAVTLTEITDTVLVFTDEAGVKYEKRYK